MIFDKNCARIVKYLEYTNNNTTINKDIKEILKKSNSIS